MDRGDQATTDDGATVFRYVLCERTPIAYRHASVGEAVRAASADRDCATVGIEVIPPDDAWSDTRIIRVGTAEWDRLASTSAPVDGEMEIPPDNRPFTLYLRTPSWVWARLAGYDTRSAAEAARAELIAAVGPYRARLSGPSDE